VVFGFGLGPFGPSLRPPFANLHGGLPAGLPSYGATGYGSNSDGSYERVAETVDPPDRVLDFFDHTIDRTVWTVTSRGRANIALVFRQDTRVRGGVVVLESPGGSRITLFVKDMQLPEGFPLDFPVGHRARAMEGGGIADNQYHLRWNVRGNASRVKFIDGFAQALEDAGWQVITKQSDPNGPWALTCRSRARPEMSCRVVVTVEPEAPRSSVYVDAADVWVGPGAESAR
jgi:hypothetical protein